MTSYSYSKRKKKRKKVSADTRIVDGREKVKHLESILPLLLPIMSYYLKNRNDLCKKSTTGCKKKRSLTWYRK